MIHGLWNPCLQYPSRWQQYVNFVDLACPVECEGCHGRSTSNENCFELQPCYRTDVVVYNSCSDTRWRLYDRTLRATVASKTKLTAEVL